MRVAKRFGLSEAGKEGSLGLGQRTSPSENKGIIIRDLSLLNIFPYILGVTYISVKV